MSLLLYEGFDVLLQGYLMPENGRVIGLEIFIFPGKCIFKFSEQLNVFPLLFLGQSFGHSDLFWDDGR